MADQREWLNMSGAQQGVFMNQRSFGAPPGQEAFTTAGTFTWVAPTGVTKVSAVAVGGGAGGITVNGGGAGGALGYKNNITVTPGDSYTVVVGNGGAGKTAFSPGSNNAGVASSFINTCTVRGGGGPAGNSTSTFTGDGGGVGGTGGNFGGGGAGGYSGKGGNGGSQAGLGGAGGGGGAGGTCCCFIVTWGSGGGGGVGLNGEGANGTAGANGGVGPSAGGAGGGGGSGGNAGGFGGSGCCATPGGSGGLHGGGGGDGIFCPCGLFRCSQGGSGARGAVRIIWPGCARSFPSTRTANE